MKTILSTLIFLMVTAISFAQEAPLKGKAEALAAAVESEVIEWRHHLHQHPELSNREFETQKYIAERLKEMGVSHTTDIAHTGVVGLIKGAKPGPVIALRADIDGLPVTELNDLPWASEATTDYNGQEVGVMHACGHDTHVAILLGVAKVLNQMKGQLPGQVKLIFQPAEEGAPEGEEGGAELMVKQGVLNNPDVDVVFGLHINSKTEVGKLGYKPGGALASYDLLKIKVLGDQTHGAYPWDGADPIVASAHIITGLQTIVSRRLKIIDEAAVVTIGSIHGGVRSNIIPDQVELVGTIRALDPDMQKQIHDLIRQTATSIAEGLGTKAEVEIVRGYPVTYNDPALTMKMLPSLNATAGEGNVLLRKAVTGAEDFSFYQQKVPGLFVILGGMPSGMNPADAAPHHTPDFYVDDAGLLLGVRTLTNLTLDYMAAHGK